MRAMYVLPALVIVAVIALSSVFIVDERKKALVLQFGQVTQVREVAGLGFKLPFIQEVAFYEDRILGVQTEPVEVTMLDDRRLVVDAFARWRITDLVRFREAVGAGAEAAAMQRLESLLRTATGNTLGTVPSSRVLSEDRTPLMNQIRDVAREQALALGVEIIDVRLIRTELPEQNLEATFSRMRAEREREAADEIARGGEAAQRVRASADRTVVELTSDARRKAEVIRGEADAERNRVLAEAFGRDPEFFSFIRSLTAYEASLKGDNSSIVMQPDSKFFDYLRTDTAPALRSGAEVTTELPAAP